MGRRKKIYVLVACEESQRVTIAFRKANCVAYSADLQRCGGNHPEWHIIGDVTPLLEGKKSFLTETGARKRVPRFDLLIAHPPCTYLCKVGSPHMVHNNILDEKRYKKMIEAKEFFFRCLNAKFNYIAVENPLPMARAELPRPTTWVQPWQFGHPYSKKTLLWLKNLPPLFPTKIMANYKEFVHSSRGKYRSRTFQGIANAMANQWTDYVLQNR